jgi:hypothetical protein
MKWLSNEPVTARNNLLASHQTIETVALSIGLAMRDIAAIQFQDDSILPPHVVNSPLQFRQFESLSHSTQDLLKGWEDKYVPEVLLDYADNVPTGLKYRVDRLAMVTKSQKACWRIQNPRKKAGAYDEVSFHLSSVHWWKYSAHGLSSVTALYSSIKSELGLIDPDWTSYPSEWRSLSLLWLRADVALAKTGCGDLSIAEINRLSIPADLKDWMISKKMSRDVHPPDSGFGKVWTAFLADLSIPTWAKGGSILQEEWCRPGKTGIVLFLQEVTL